MILEGSLLHYGAPRVVRAEDPDLALLLGDQLYALGLSRLAALGDLEAVAELADLISLLAQARAAADARARRRDLGGRRGRDRLGRERRSTRPPRRWPAAGDRAAVRRASMRSSRPPRAPMKHGLCDARLVVDGTLTRRVQYGLAAVDSGARGR